MWGMSNSQAIKISPARIAPIAVGDGAHFGKILATARILAGLTAAALASKVGCTSSLIGMRERHDRRLSVDDAIIVLHAMGYRLVVMPAALAPLEHTPVTDAQP
jgi:transcriptional regulator with XRE-family HTH domain